MRSVVPKQGMVMPTTSVAGLPVLRAASVATRSASVESSPPETPMTGLPRVTSIRFFSPMTCISKIPIHRSARSAFVSGTNGSRLTG